MLYSDVVREDFLELTNKDKNIVNRQRPVNLDLATLKFPPTAIVSILHRASGVLIFLGIPFLLYVLSASLESATSFVTLQQQLSMPHFKFLLWIISSALAYHIFAGIRHVVLDFGIGETIQSAIRSAYALIILTGIMVLFLGIWLW